MAKVGAVFKGITAFLVVALVTPAVTAGVALATLLFLPLPATLPEAKPITGSQATHVYDAAGNEIAVFKEFETAIVVPPTEIPDILKQAVIAAEDQNFYEHGGIDVMATLRALWSDLRNQAIVEGGSTITQQYVKNAFTGGERSVARKIREAILASQLDRQVDKEEILYRYLSTIYLGGGTYGVGAFAQSYFRKPVSQLTLSEAALLAGVIPAPSSYEPRAHPDVADLRRQRTLRLMLEQGRITRPQYDEAIVQGVWLSWLGDPPVPAVTLIQPPETQVSVQPWFTDYVRQWLEAHLPDCVPGNCPTLYRGGLTVETTLDPLMQLAAEQETARQMGSHDPRLQMSIVAVEPPTGFIKAMIGGRDYAYSQVNVSMSARQPGSSFKPYILAAAFEAGIQPTKVYSGSALVLPDGTRIQNYGNASFGALDLRRGTWSSVNGVYARLILDVGVDRAMAMADKLGAPMPAYDPAYYGASVALGAVEVSPLDMASAFGVFANHGKRAEPTPVLRVTQCEGTIQLGCTGTVLLDNTKAAEKAAEVVPSVVADNVTDVLRGVLTDGTARGKDIGRPAAGKTGTAEDFGNAWFVGYTPTLSTAVWMGYIDCNCPLRGINGVGGVTGGTLPASSWERFMERALENVPVTEFAEPPPIQTYSDSARRAVRRGFDAGARRYPTAAPTGAYFDALAPPQAVAPTTTTTPPASSTTTTNTTIVPPPTTPTTRGIPIN